MNGATFKEDFPEGLTIAELKKLLAHWPDLAPDGAPWRVWVKTDGLFVTELVRRVAVLGKYHLEFASMREEDG